MSCSFHGFWHCKHMGKHACDSQNTQQQSYSDFNSKVEISATKQQSTNL